MSRILAKNIAYLRQRDGRCSQEKLGDNMGGIKKARIGAYEEGRSLPPVDMLIRFSDHFNVTIDDLIKVDLSKT